MHTNMAQEFQLISSICISLLFLLLLVPYSNSENSRPKKPLVVPPNPTLTFLQSSQLSSSSNQSQPFGFLNHLKGGKKGEKLAGIRELKKYLNKFGYLNYYKSINAHDNDHFDDTLEAAVKAYQANYNIKITGMLDSETISKMAMPRCGMPDIINGTNTMAKKHHHEHQHRSPNYSFFPGNRRWPAGKTCLTYSFNELIAYQSIKDAIRSAFNRWAWYTRYFTFRETSDRQNSDITITYYRGDHGDGAPFDGPGGVLAHAFAPTDGRLHLDVDESWSIGAINGYIDLESVAVHEIGHILGLGHSSIQNAIMFPSISSGVVKRNFHGDDVQAIRALYNI